MSDQKEGNVFDRAVRWLDSGEHSFVTFLSKVTPLLVPLIPAYVGYSHVTKELGFNQFFGIAYGAVIEFLGYSSIYKAVQFWEYNKKYTSDKAPLRVAIVIYLGYLLVTLAVNVLLDIQSGVMWWRVVAIGGISLLSVPAGLLMSISAIHTERTIAREQAVNERRERRRERTNEPFVRKNKRTRTNEQMFGVRRKIELFVRSKQANEQRTPGPSEIANAIGCAKSYASETLQMILGEQENE